MRLTEALLFLPLAAGLHVGAWAIAPTSMGAFSTGGPGQAQVMLTAATAQQMALAKTWQAPPRTPPVPRPTSPLRASGAPPEISPDQMMPILRPAPLLPAVLPAAPPDISARPSLTAPPDMTPPPSLPQPQISTPSLSQPSQTPPDATVQNPPSPRLMPPRPDTRPLVDATPPMPPKPIAKQNKSASAPSAPQQNAGGGKTRKSQSGKSGKDATQSANNATRNALQAKWGAKIQSKVLRRLIYPRGTNGTGVARVALTIDRDGRLTGLRLAKSSGVAAFDQAALTAVRRVGRFPKAPDALTKPNYTFSMSLTFKP